MAVCEHCDRLKSAIVDTSQVHHNLLMVLEAAQKYADIPTAGIQHYLGKALADLEEAIRALNDHQRTHR